MEAQSELGRLTAALERKVQIVTVILAVLGTLLILGCGYLLFRVRPKRVQALPQNTTDHARFTKEAPHEGERKGGEISRASLPCTDEFTASAESLGRGDVATCSTPLPRDAYFPSETPRATFPPTHVPQVATRDEGSSSRTPNP